MGSAQGQKVRQWLRFGVFDVDLSNGELFRSGLRIPIQQQPFEILRLLLAAPGELVTREQLRRALWPADTFVDFDASLNAAIKRLRRALHDSPANPRFIATVPRRGYRFIAPVAARSAADAAAAKPAARRMWPLLTVAAAMALLLLAYLFRPAYREPKVTDMVNLTEPASIPGEQQIVTDGTSVYFNEETGGRLTLARVPVSGGRISPVPLPWDATRVDLLDISPDGALLLVHVREGGHLPLWAVPLQGGSPHRMGNIEAREAAWSRDGKKLAYTFAGAVYLAGGNGSARRLLAHTPGLPYDPRWSPDGRFVRVTLLDPDSRVSELEDVDVASGRLRPVLAPLPAAAPPGLWSGDWTPDGRYFVFAPQASAGGLWVRRERGAFWRRRSEEPVRLTTGPVSLLRPIVSRDGRHLFAIGHFQRGELLRYDLHAKRLEPYWGGASLEQVTFSRDGRWAACVSYPGGELWRLNLRDGSRLQLGAQGELHLRPQWSPQGDRLAFTIARREGPWRIAVVARDGGPISEITPPEVDASDPAWAPDGQRLAFTYRDWHGGDLPRVGILDLHRRRIEFLPAAEGMDSLQWSPDGRFLLARSPGRGIAVFSFRRRLWRIVYARSVNDPRWSPDGRYIYFNTFQQPQSGVFRLRFLPAVAEAPAPSSGGLAAEEVASLSRFPAAGLLGPWSGFAPDGSPLVLRDVGHRAIYRLDWSAPR